MLKFIEDCSKLFKQLEQLPLKATIIHNIKAISILNETTLIKMKPL